MAKPTESKTSPAESNSKKVAQPRKWWQWLLLYPGLLIALLGAVPTYMELVKSYRLGVPFGQSFDAQEQNRLWQENFQCIQNATFSIITNKHNVEIGSAVCASGDVLLQGKRPESNQQQFRWVSWRKVAPSEALGKGSNAFLRFFSTAQATETERLILAQARPTSVLCQRWIGYGQLLQRIATPMGCFDQVINTFNGWVIRSSPAPCNPYC